MSQSTAVISTDEAAPRSAWGWTAATAVVLALAYALLLYRFFVQQWHRPHYQHFPFVLAALGWMLWTRVGEAAPQEANPGSRRIGEKLLLTLSLITLTFSLPVFSDSPWLGMVSFAFFVAWGFKRISRDWHVPYLWGIWLFLPLIIPPPMYRDQALISYLQGRSSRASSFVLDLLGVMHLMSGNRLELPTKKFFVDEACSGIISVMSISACAVIYAVWRRRSPFHLAALLASGLAWATVMNVIRIVTVAVAFDKFGVDWSAGTSHEVLSLVIFTLSFLGLISTDLALVSIAAPITPELESQSGAEPVYGKWLIRVWDWLQQWGAPGPEPIDEPTLSSPDRLSILDKAFHLGAVPLAAFAVLGVLQFADASLIPRTLDREIAGKPNALRVDESTAARTCGAVERTNYFEEERERGNDVGQYSRTYAYADEAGDKYTVSFDFPFGPDWHDLAQCYMGSGWQMASRLRTIPRDREIVDEHATPEEQAEANWGFVEMEFKKSTGEALYVVYSLFDDRGNRTDPPFGSIFREAYMSLFYRVKSSDRYYQVQVVCGDQGGVDDKQKNQAIKLLQENRRRLRAQVLNGNPESGSSAPAPPSTAPPTTPPIPTLTPPTQPN